MDNSSYQQSLDKRRRSFIFTGASLFMLPIRGGANSFGIRECRNEAFYYTRSFSALFGKPYGSRDEYFDEHFGPSGWQLPDIVSPYLGHVQHWTAENAHLQLNVPHIPEQFEKVRVNIRFESGQPEDYEIELIIEIRFQPDPHASATHFRYFKASHFKLVSQIVESSTFLRVPGTCGIFAAIKGPSLRKALVSRAEEMLNLNGCNDYCIYSGQSIEECAASNKHP